MTINREYIYKLSESEWNDFMALLAKPVEDKPKLRLLMSRKAPWEDDDEE